MTNDRILPGSFRDPSGFLFEGPDGHLYRQINEVYAEDFAAFHESGLYDELADLNLIVSHEQADKQLAPKDGAVAVIKPERLPFVSYPYEWCFSQLRSAARLTLDIQRRALQRGMSLKDASAYNVMFRGSQPVFIDSLSFERVPAGKPWIAYKQFCEHFLAPLAIMAYVDPDLGRIQRTYIDGIPLPVAARMLKGKGRFNIGLMMHLRAHARMIETTAPGSGASRSRRTMSDTALSGLVSSLDALVSKLTPKKARSVWHGYAGAVPYSPDADKAKRAIVRKYLAACSPDSVWDLGANTGEYSEIALEFAANVVALEQDHNCVEEAFGRWTATNTDILALRSDLGNPSPGLGWDHDERDSLVDRGPADVVMALALIHHLSITNNVPLERIARFLARCGRHAIVEFVDKSDPMAQQLLHAREDVFREYSRSEFERAFESHFELHEHEQCGDANRIVYRMRALRWE